MPAAPVIPNLLRRIPTSPNVEAKRIEFLFLRRSLVSQAVSAMVTRKNTQVASECEESGERDKQFKEKEQAIATAYLLLPKKA